METKHCSCKDSFYLFSLPLNTELCQQVLPYGNSEGTRYLKCRGLLNHCVTMLDNSVVNDYQPLAWRVMGSSISPALVHNTVYYLYSNVDHGCPYCLQTHCESCGVNVTGGQRQCCKQVTEWGCNV